MARYSTTPLLKKLGIKPGHRCVVHNEPAAYWEWLSPLPEGVTLATRGEADFIHLFTKNRKDFEKQLMALKKDGMLWVSWPKKASKVPTDLNENVIRDFGLKYRLVDVKVCAVDEVWSGLKLVYRLTDR